MSESSGACWAGRLVNAARSHQSSPPRQQAIASIPATGARPRPLERRRFPPPASRFPPFFPLSRLPLPLYSRIPFTSSASGFCLGHFIRSAAKVNNKLLQFSCFFVPNRLRSERLYSYIPIRPKFSRKKDANLSYVQNDRHAIDQAQGF